MLKFTRVYVVLCRVSASLMFLFDYGSGFVICLIKSYDVDLGRYGLKSASYLVLHVDVKCLDHCYERLFWNEILLCVSCCFSM